jgi:NitT/TauT family transport system ATP-binding protein
MPHGPVAAPQIMAAGIAVEYGGHSRGSKPVRVMEGVDLAVGQGDFVSLIGPSGCGKSTLLKVLSGLLPVAAGHVEVAGLAPQEAARQRRIGVVFQDATLLPWKSALDNAGFLLGLADRSRPRAAVREQARDMLRLVGLEASADLLPTQLSGGMRQRVSIARALALDPEVLMMDEPFGALDAITRETMSEFLLELWQRTGKTVVLVTHSIDEAVFLSTRVHVMAAGPARIIGTVAIDLPRPRGAHTYQDPAFTQAAGHLRTLLKAGHPG